MPESVPVLAGFAVVLMENQGDGPYLIKCDSIMP
jgi:hypothetical protein